ncbi:MAG TPA: EamA family transporter [Chloroflexaceae bacterium]|nr:EamA family transporter [Chloroflexaceae bacterium]
MAVQSRAEGPPARVGFTRTDLTMVAVVLIWGANFSVTKIALQQIPPLAFAGLRFVFASALLWAVLRATEGARPLPPGALRKLIWLGVVGNSIYQLGFLLGLSYTTAANASLIIATTPAMVAAAGAALGIERLRRVAVVGIALAIGGVVLILSARGLSFGSTGVLGDLLLLGCAISWTVYTLGVRSLGGGLSPLAITTWTTITGTPGLLLIGLPQLVGTDWLAVGPAAWVGLAYSTVLGVVVAYLLWNNSVRVAGSNKTAIYGTAIPLVATLVAWPVLGEAPTLIQGVGAALIVTGVLLTRRQ